MADSLFATASSWAGTAVACRFTATADGTALSALDDTAPVYDIPSGTTEVQITATPKASVYWPATVTLTVSSAGVLSAATGSDAFVELLTATGSSSRVTIATLKVSRFKDVTSDVLALLSKPPAKRAGKTVTEIADHQAQYGAWPPPDWELPAVSSIHFLNPANPVSAGALNFTAAPSFTLDVENVVLKLAGVNAPQLFAVVWPKAIAPKAGAAPTPIFLFVRQGCGQNVPAGYFKSPSLDPYPDNFDYADTGLFQNLHYADTPISEYWGPKGVPYQVAKAGAKVVTVIPCNSVGPEFGVLGQTEETGRILAELQAFMFWRAGIKTPPATIGKTAIAAFSSGNYYLNNWLKDASNRKGAFLTNTVSAVYFLDPPTAEIDGFIASALTWANGAGGDKRIRLYSRVSTAAHKKLLRAAPPAEPYIKNSSDDRHTAGVLTLSSWTKTFKNVFGRDATLDWQYAHHTIAATMLTHALAQGDL